MNLHTARTLFVTDRMDWNRPHLRWISDRAYRYYRSLRRRTA